MSKTEGFFDLHMHTPLCGHAVGEPREYVDAAARNGVGRIAITCHMPFDRWDFGGPRIRMPEALFPRYLELVDDAREYGARQGVTVTTGIEGEVCPEPDLQARLGDFLRSHPFDFILGSVHHQLGYYQNWFAERGLRTDAQIIPAYFECLRDGASTGLFHSMSHPDVIRLYGTLSGPFEPERYERVIREAIAAAVEADVCWELNTSGCLKGPGIEHPVPIIREWGREMGLKLTLGSDSHQPATVGQFFPEMVTALQAAGYAEVYYFEGGVRKAVALDSLGKTRVPS